MMLGPQQIRKHLKSPARIEPTQAVRQIQDASKNMLCDGLRAIATNIANRDSKTFRGRQIDVVSAGSGQPDESKFRIIVQ